MTRKPTEPARYPSAIAWLLTAVLAVAASVSAAPAETENPFWTDGEPVLEIQEIFTGQRFPDVVVAMDGTVIVFRCQNHPITLRRSEDGGKTWGPEIATSQTRHEALGAAVVDENTGDILVFPDFIVAEPTMYRSRDHGKTWAAETVARLPDG